MAKNAMIVGGGNGIGLALANRLSAENYEKIIIADKSEPDMANEKFEFMKTDLRFGDFGLFDRFKYVDTLIITAGFGRTTLFENIHEKEIENSFRVNAEAVIQIIRKYYDKLNSKENFDCMIMGSIAGLVSSPMFAVYAATKAALCRFAESVNIELEKNGAVNRILNVSPGSIKGTKFNGGSNNIDLLDKLSDEIISRMRRKETLYIPEYETIYKDVLKRYGTDAHKFGAESYQYKADSGRINNKSSVKVGYLSGTFDLFHIGHLNLLKRAKAMCDYLVVGVHKDASHKGKTAFIPYEERAEIVAGIKYVDKVVMAEAEDMDAYEKIKYDYLFVGSDYKGTERFLKYEKFFEDKNTEIVYFPYTKGTSSTQLRNTIERNG